MTNLSQHKIIFLFGDQTVELYSSILNLHRHASESFNLRQFFIVANQAIRKEISSSSYWEEHRLPEFESLLALAETISQDVRNEATTTTVLLCAIQLGNLILLAENHPIILDKSSEVNIASICTGALVGAVLDVATSAQDLIDLTPAIIRIALRVGITASQRSHAIERSKGNWAISVFSISVNDIKTAINSFKSKHNCRSDKQIFISSSAENAFTISGPPSLLEDFLESGLLKSARHVRLPLGAIFHAPHLLMPDIDAIIQKDNLPFSSRLPKGSIVSISTGKPYDCNTLSDLLTEVISDVLSKPIDLEDFVKGLASTIGQFPAILMPVGPINSNKYIKRRLEELNCQIVEHVSTLSRQVSVGRSSGSIAIVGMAGRFPGGETLEEFWKVLEDGLDLHRKVPADRFDVNTHYDPSGKLRNSTLTPYGVFIDNPGHFDARMFNMSPREAAQTDPMQRLLLMTTYEALEMSGYSPGRTPSTQSHRIGSFFGQTSDDWREVNAAQDIDTYFITGGIRAFGPGRLNYHFKWEGPSYSIDTACSSSFASIQLACSALRALECDTAVAGGANILTASDLFSGLSRGGFLSPTGGCKTFDDTADGYCRGDAVGTVILKRLEDAIGDNDRILSVIRGIDTNHSADAVSITHPHSVTQQKLFHSVLRQACLIPEDVDYVEMHGTGTQAGDYTEFSSVSNVFAENRSLNRPLYIGTLKPNIGHGEAASGVTSLIKAVMMLWKNTIPPHVGIKNKINHRLPSMDELGIVLPRINTPWLPNGVSKRRIVINNFDAAGGNTSLLLEDPPSSKAHQSADPRKHYVVAITGRTPKALRDNRIRLLKHLQIQDLRLEDISYTTTARRQHHIYRSAYDCKNVPSLLSSLQEDVKQSIQPDRMPESHAVFVFTGQGSEWAGMGKQLYETNSFCRTIFHQHDSICTSLDFPSFIDLFTNPSIDLSATSPLQVQLAIVSFELTLASLWQQWGIRPNFTIGHSLGEYPAMVTSGILSLSDMFYLVGSRARILQENCSESTHSMLAMKLSEVDAQGILRQNPSLACHIACINSPLATVLSGRKDDIAQLKSRLDVQKIKVTVLNVKFAFHSPQMDPVLEKYRLIAEDIKFTEPTIPFASTCLGKIIETDSIITAKYLMQQTRQPVDFVSALRALQAKGFIDDHTLWIDLGPQPLCLNMIRATLNAHPSCLVSVNDTKKDFWAVSAQALAQSYNNGFDIQWNNYHKEYENSLVLLELPSYAFDTNNYWIKYEGDWSLIKGEKRREFPSLEEQAFQTTTLQSIESEKHQDGSFTVEFISNLAEKHLRTAVCGHLVNGVYLCPSSVYGDMAITAAMYIFSKTHRNATTIALDVSNMEVTKPLLASFDGKNQCIKTTATKNTYDTFVNICFSSHSGETRTDHASCVVNYGDGEQWMSRWARNAYFVKGRIDHLMQGLAQHRTQQVLRPMAYKLFSSLVKYDKRYQGMQQVYLDSDLSEAAADIKFQSAYSDGKFLLSPYWIDSILHLSGFILNGSDKTPEDIVYISHGWQNMRVARPLSPDKKYRNYVRMQPTNARGIMAGDVYVFEGENIIAVCEGLKFQEIKRKVLNQLLPSVQSENLTDLKPSTKFTQKSITEPPKSQFDEILEIIASEAEVNMEEFVDSARLVELGIDSLLAIGIVERLRVKLKDIQIPSSIFFDFPTIAQLRAFFSNNSLDSSDGGTSRQYEDTSEETTATSGTELADFEELKSQSFSELLRIILSEELQMPESEIQSSTRFAEIGVDSLMALNLVSVIRSKVDEKVDSNFFFDHPSFGDVLKFEPSREGHIRNPASTATITKSKFNSESFPQATSIILQQGLDSRSSLFMFPDGAGSASSYAALPRIHPTITVYGLNSPFLEYPAFNESLTRIVSLYVDEIRVRQRSGPYILGGWSIGGVYAYEAARQLIIQGEQVLGIVLIDSPCPTKLPPMSIETIDLLEKLSTFEKFPNFENKISLSVRQHFQGSICALKEYKLESIPDAKKPHCLAIWARHGVLETNTKQLKLIDKIDLSDPTSRWILQPRMTIGGNGWEKLMSTIECRVAQGNHFTMMQRPEIQTVADCISKFIKDIIK